MGKKPQRPTPTPPRGLESTEEPTLRDYYPFITPRVLFLFVVFASVLGVFCARIYQFTVLQGAFFASESENNYTTELPVIAPRGRILDRNGQPLAINRPLFDIEMSPFGLHADEITSAVQRLAALLGEPRVIEKADAVIARRPRWKSVRMIEEVPLARVLPVLERAFELPGVVVRPRYERDYPNGDIAGLITGHVGAIPRSQLEAWLEKGYLRNETVGKLGAELAFETWLHGVNGEEIVIRDARGKPRARQIATPAQPGHTVVLTLDLRLQRLADALLEGVKGVILIMDPRDGAVLAMAQRPKYDPNSPARGSSFNKATKGTFPPGSTYKVVTAAAGLNAGFAPTDRTYCDGNYELPGVKFRFPCHLRWGHEWVDLHDALQKSCNVYFYNWSHKMGYRAMEDAAHAFGFGFRTDFELTPPAFESAGVAGKPTALLGNRLHMAIGQGELIDVTPIQLIRAYATIANGGHLNRPRIVKEILGPDGFPVAAGPLGLAQPQGDLPYSKTDMDQIREGLRRVVHERGGTGFRVGFKPEWRVAGKTGTAETGRPGVEPHAWFCGYAPFDNPEVVLVVLIEESGHGGEVAGPIARQLFAHYFGQPEPQIVPPITELQLSQAE